MQTTSNLFRILCFMDFKWIVQTEVVSFNCRASFSLNACFFALARLVCPVFLRLAPAECVWWTSWCLIWIYAPVLMGQLLFLVSLLFLSLPWIVYNTKISADGQRSEVTLQVVLFFFYLIVSLGPNFCHALINVSSFCLFFYWFHRYTARYFR